MVDLYVLMHARNSGFIDVITFTTVNQISHTYWYSPKLIRVSLKYHLPLISSHTPTGLKLIVAAATIQVRKYSTQKYWCTHVHVVSICLWGKSMTLASMYELLHSVYSTTQSASWHKA